MGVTIKKSGIKLYRDGESITIDALKGTDGSDASVTKENIESALGYVPVSSNDIVDKDAFAQLGGDLYRHQSGKYVVKLIADEYVEPDGRILPYARWSRTDYIDVSDVDSVYITLHPSTKYAAWYNADKTFLQKANIYEGDLLETVVPTGAAYLIVAQSTAIMSGFELYKYPISEVLDKIEKINDVTMSGDIPEYDVQMMDTKLPVIVDYDASSAESFAFITDYHDPANGGTSVSLLKRIWNKTNISFVCFGGDALTSRNTKADAMESLRKFQNMFAPFGERYYPIIGNHEFNDPDSRNESKRLNLSQVQSAMYSRLKADAFSGYTAYYIDNNISKMRYYFIGCKHNSTLYDEDIAWMIHSFLTIPKGYTVLVFSHTGLTYDSNYNPTGLVGRIAYIAKAFLSAKNKLTSFHSYYGVDEWLDFSQCEFDIAGFITGHVHFDGNYEYSVDGLDGSVNVIAITCDATQEYGGLDRTIRTNKEQAFAVATIDKSERKIRLIRIGAGINRDYYY